MRPKGDELNFISNARLEAPSWTHHHGGCECHTHADRTTEAMGVTLRVRVKLEQVFVAHWLASSRDVG